MLCSLPRSSLILLLLGTGRVVWRDNFELDNLQTHFGSPQQGLQETIVIDVEIIAYACGCSTQ